MNSALLLVVVAQLWLPIINLNYSYIMSKGKCMFGIEGLTIVTIKWNRLFLRTDKIDPPEYP